MQTIIIVFIICFFIYKILKDKSPSPVEFADVVQDTLIIYSQQFKHALQKYDDARQDSIINDDIYTEQKAYQELAQFIQNSENNIKKEMSEFKNSQLKSEK